MDNTLPFPDLLRRYRNQRGLTVRGLAPRVNASRGLLGDLESGRRRPAAALAADLDRTLGAGGALVQAAARPADPPPTADLIARIQASDTSPTTLHDLTGHVYNLCCQYPWRPAPDLLADTHRWLRRTCDLLRHPVGLHAHRELLVQAGWLALLAACLEHDTDRPGAADATRTAAHQLGVEAGHGGITAWSWEIVAWMALCQGRYRDVQAATQAGLVVAGGESSAAAQLAGQQARAVARLGQHRQAQKALDHALDLLGRQPPPHRPEHHFAVDPAKWDLWAMDTHRLAGHHTAAAQAALRIITQPDVAVRAPMRAAEARLTLATVAAHACDLEQAAAVGVDALRGPRRSLPSLRMVAGEVERLLLARWPTEPAVARFREAARSLVHV